MNLSGDDPEHSCWHWYCGGMRPGAVPGAASLSAAAAAANRDLNSESQGFKLNSRRNSPGSNRRFRVRVKCSHHESWHSLAGCAAGRQILSNFNFK